MTFKQLTEQDVQFIRVTHRDDRLPWRERMRILSDRFQVQERTVRKWIKKLGISKYSEIQSEQLRSATVRVLDVNKQYYILTYAQNTTPVHLELWRNIEAYAEFLDAEICVIAGRYKNPDIYADPDKLAATDEWDTSVRPYLTASRQEIGQRVLAACDVKVQPTAVNPLSGFTGFAGGKTCIFGHPKQHLMSLPVFKGTPHVLHLTTGACTIRNYSDTKAGKKGEFHHVYGFVIVEIDGDDYHIRQVSATDSGSFSDLYYTVENGEVTQQDSCAGFVAGDLHESALCGPVLEATMDLLDMMPPKHLMLHDLLDGESVCHWIDKNPVAKYRRYASGGHDIDMEISRCLDLLRGLKSYNPVVVRSNHDEWLDRHVDSQDWRKDIVNAPKYIEMAGLLLSGAAPKGLLPYYIEREFGDDVKALGVDESFRIGKWEVGQHGHYGINGARGTIEQFRKLPDKVIVGHYHIPQKRDGAIAVGTYTNLDLDYTKGPSAWMHCGALIHNNGSAQQIFFNLDGQQASYTTFDYV